MSSGGGDTSEEKTLPPSAKKLKDMRKKGRVSRSTDMVAGASTTVAAIFLALTAGMFTESFRNSAHIIFGLQSYPFEVASWGAVKALGLYFGVYLALLLMIVVAVVIATNIVINGGVLFSFDPIKLDFNRLNPVEGLKRIFSVRTAVELSKNLIKIALLFSLCLVALVQGLNAIFSVPFCGLTCVGPVANRIAAPLIGIAIAILLLSGLIDIALQRWLFRRDNRMTKTEAKRERKDEEGSPEVRTTMRRMRMRFMQPSSRYSEEDATIFIEGFSTAVGLRFVRNETPLPIVVCKARGSSASDTLYAAQGQKIHFDDDFAVGLAQKLEVGAPLTEAFFEPFIRALKVTGQI